MDQKPIKIKCADGIDRTFERWGGIMRRGILKGLHTDLLAVCPTCGEKYPYERLISSIRGQLKEHSCKESDVLAWREKMSKNVQIFIDAINVRHSIVKVKLYEPAWKDPLPGYIFRYSISFKVYLDITGDEFLDEDYSKEGGGIPVYANEAFMKAIDEAAKNIFDTPVEWNNSRSIAHLVVEYKDRGKEAIYEVQ